MLVGTTLGSRLGNELGTELGDTDGIDEGAGTTLEAGVITAPRFPAAAEVEPRLEIEEATVESLVAVVAPEETEDAASTRGNL